MNSGIRTFWYLVPLAVFGFILFNALTPSEASNEMTWGFLNTFLGRGLRDAMAIVQGAVPTDEAVFVTARTMAHFGEYFLLALTSYLALRFNLEYIPNIVYCLFFGVMTALLDETLQGFTAGRSAQVSDIRLDFYGFAAAMLIAVLLDRLFCGEWVSRSYRKRHASWR